MIHGEDSGREIFPITLEIITDGGDLGVRARSTKSLLGEATMFPGESLSISDNAGVIFIITHVGAKPPSLLQKLRTYLSGR